MGVYQRLGVQPVINARGMNTMASGSLMPQAVLDAMAEASTAFVDMEELKGRRRAYCQPHRRRGRARHVGFSGRPVALRRSCHHRRRHGRHSQSPRHDRTKDGIVIEKCRRIRYDQALRLPVRA